MALKAIRLEINNIHMNNEKDLERNYDEIEYETEEQEKEENARHMTEFLIYKMGIDAANGFKDVPIPYSRIF